ncbi:MAG TPA: c(7)-type cytochrome triheme domain-containing protein [Candidatus Angelobacter sp.]
MRRRRKHFTLVLVTCLAASFFAYAGNKKQKILHTLFDGVPTAEEREAERAKKRAAKHSANVLASVPVPAPPTVPAERARPAIEKLRTWDEVLAALPRDAVGGADWVKAIQNGVIAPRHRVPSDTLPAAPFTLANLVPATASETAPALDLNIEIVPEKTALYKVVFPHAGHTLWLNCSSCHPGIVTQRGSGMQKILSGEYCGKCHGKVAFSPLTSCARCHVNLLPASAETISRDLEKSSTDPIPASPEAVARGKAVYSEACAVCHGDAGDGNGPLSAALAPKPRNFTSGKFKFRSTSFSSIPADSDLFRTITRGIPGTSMPSFSFLSYEDRFAILHYIKTFSEKFAKQKPAAPVKIPDPPPLTPELLAMGKQFFKDAECFKCHGETGRGDGPSSVGMKDDWGEPLRPFDFTRGRPKGGDSLKDYYRDLMTGLQGTPMPDFGDTFEPEQAWSVIYYVRSLGAASRDLPEAVKGDIFFTRAKMELQNGPVGVPATEPTRGGAGLELASASQPEPTDNVPPATFPHWFHRVRVRCAACHSDIFEMKAGANNITMDAIRAGKFCGRCHPSYPDSKALAWPVAFESCVRCHVAR